MINSVNVMLTPGAIGTEEWPGNQLNSICLQHQWWVENSNFVCLLFFQTTEADVRSVLSVDEESRSVCCWFSSDQSDAEYDNYVQYRTDSQVCGFFELLILFLKAKHLSNLFGSESSLDISKAISSASSPLSYRDRACL